MNAGSALSAGKLPPTVHLALVLLMLVCSASASRIAAAAKVCRAADPALNLTKDAASGVYYAANDEELQRMCACSTIDYARIGWGAGGSCTCAQETLDACRLESISSKDPSFGVSLGIVNCPLIRSVQGLARVSGALSGGLHVHVMAELTTLEGLGNISHIGQDGAGLSIHLVRNKKLASASALSNAKGDFSSASLAISANPLLACVPEHWAVKEQSSTSMGSSLWLFSCDSTTGTCFRTANGTQSESACARSCVGGRIPKAAPAPAPAGTRAAKVCKASDPALNLSYYDYSGTGYYVADDGQLQRMCACSTIDYAYIGCLGDSCPTCKQATLDACLLEAISGKGPYGGASLGIWGPAPLITSLRGLARLSALPGGLIVQGMDNLTTLEGLGNITRIGIGRDDNAGIDLSYNPKLGSAMALSNAKGKWPAKDANVPELSIEENPQLGCVPEHWPAKDANGVTIRNGKALHDPCQYQCVSYSDAHCFQWPTGAQSKSACASRCMKVCQASDPALNLTMDDDGRYYAADDEQLQRMCACSTIDYARIGSDPYGGAAGCPTCAQGTLDACRLESISGKDPYYGRSLTIYGPAPLITSLRGLARLSGALPGGLYVEGMDELTTLEGLGNITRIGEDNAGTSIYLGDNPKLASAMALSNAKGNFTSDALIIDGNSQLACVPEQWPAKDSRGATIRNGKALHDPCQYRCDSAAAHTCSQTATGTQSESACASSCVARPKPGHRTKSLSANRVLPYAAAGLVFSLVVAVLLVLVKRKRQRGTMDTDEPLLPNKSSISHGSKRSKGSRSKKAVDEASARCADRWSRYHTDEDDIVVDVEYEVLKRATNGFDELSNLIGRGGSCGVFKGDVCGVAVAVKMMNDTGHRGSGGDRDVSRQQAWANKQVMAEIELLCRVRHPNINRLLGVSSNGPHRCLVLEYMNGGALDDRLRDHNLSALPWKARATALLHVARGLVYMHRLNPPVVHRDIKGGNVLLHYPRRQAAKAYRPGLVVKISDFGEIRIQKRLTLKKTCCDLGIVRINREQKEGVLRTSERTHASTQRICGTSPYMAPEYKERGQVSARTDAFAVGILAIELLTSFDPYAAREIADESSQDELAFVVRQHHDKDPDAVPISANSREMAEGILPVLPCEWPLSELEGFGDVAARCACHQAKKRATVADVLPALEELVGNAGPQPRIGISN